MNRPLSALHTLGATVLLNGALMPVAFAAWEPPVDHWSLLLIGSLAVLAVGTLLKLGTRREDDKSARSAYGSRFFGPQLYPQARNDQELSLHGH